MLNPSMLIDDDYCLVECLGHGGFGEVWLADQKSLGNRVALKFVRNLHIDPAAAYQFLKNEGQKLRALAVKSGYGSNILYVNRVGKGTQEHPPYLDLELMEGGSLKQKLERVKSLSQKEVVDIAIQVITALSCAHGNEIVHGDVKPHNVLLSGDGSHVKLSDFGLARRFGEMSDSGWGTPMYMSPEHFKSPESVGPASDIYSFGVLLFQCLEGKPPFICDDRSGYENAHCKKRPPSLTNVSVTEEMQGIVTGCMAKSAAKRPGLSQLLEQLQGMSRGNDKLPSHPSSGRLSFAGMDGGGNPVVHHGETGLSYYANDAGTIFIPERPATNLDYYRFVNQPQFREYQPGLMPFSEHDGAYLNHWYMGKPLKAEHDLPVGNITWSTASACATWLGGRLPAQSELSDLFYGPKPSAMYRQLVALIEERNYPYLAFWCREYDDASDLKPMWLLLPPSSPFKTSLVCVRRPGYFCFPHYLLLPLLSRDKALGIFNTGHDPLPDGLLSRSSDTVNVPPHPDWSTSGRSY